MAPSEYGRSPEHKGLANWPGSAREPASSWHPASSAEWRKLPGRDFLNERINETLDKAYRHNLSRYVSAAMVEKAANGLANGLPPLGYMSQQLPAANESAGYRTRRLLPRGLAALRASNWLQAW